MSIWAPKIVIDQYETGFMDDSLSVAIDHCLDLDREDVYEKSKKWTWETCWLIFKNNLVKI